MDTINSQTFVRVGEYATQKLSNSLSNTLCRLAVELRKDPTFPRSKHSEPGIQEAAAMEKKAI